MTSSLLKGRVVRGAQDAPALDQALAELAEDSDTLICLIDRRARALQRLRSELNQPSIPEWVQRETKDRVDSILEADAASIVSLHHLREQSALLDSVEDLTRAIQRQAELMRSRQALAAGLFVAADWHSPSIGHSVHSTAGPRQGTVRLHHDDYKRDRHHDEAAWEAEWLREMVDNPSSHPLRALMTASGMAAFTTILAHVEDQGGQGPVLMGAGTYHECRQLLTRSVLGQRTINLPETNGAAWHSALDRNPSAVFVDTICNAAGLAVPDVVWLIEALHARRRQVMLVLDNTARSVSFQPWRHLPAGSPVRVISFESLTKYAQLGMDRAAGGVIVAPTPDAENMDVLREHLGTNIADIVVHQHPWPDRRLLERRLARIGRNVALIAVTLSRRLAERKGPLQVVYPGLSATPGMRPAGFHGGFLAIETAASSPDGLYRSLITSILDLAAARRVPICHGTSFGFDTTRLYLTAADSEYGTPFLRVSAGNEHVLGAQAVADVLADALEQVS